MMIDRFLEYMRHERNRSELTIKSYEEDLRAFETYFKGLEIDGLTWETIDADIIRGWMEGMMDKRNTATSINRRLSALRSFYRFALSRGLVPSDPAHLVKGPKKRRPLPQYLREVDMDRLIDDIPWDCNNFNNVRARTIILLFYETGIRLAELASLDDTSVDFIQKEIKVHGKRDKERLIPLGDEMVDSLLGYIKMRDERVTRKNVALFVTEKGERMKHFQIRNEVKRCLAHVTTMKKKSPHVLRHTFATAMLNHEAGLESVKKLLGHESLATTEIYTHTTFEQLKKTYSNAHPRA